MVLFQGTQPSWLLTYYEYTPLVTDIDDGLFYGGRAQAWIGDFVKIGASAMTDQSGTVNRELLGADITLRMNAGTYIKAEFAQTKGPGYGEVGSGDGGFFSSPTNNGSGTGAIAPFSNDAVGYRIEAAADLAELGVSQIGGVLTAYYQHRDAGFAAPGQYTANEIDQFGVSATVQVAEGIEVRGAFDHTSDVTSNSDRSDANLDVVWKVSDNWSVGGGVGYVENTSGDRLDVGGEVRYHGQDYEVYAFGQLTAAVSGTLEDNNRFGVGGNVKVTEKLSIGGEISEGDGGLGARLSADYHYSDRTEYYLAYELTDRTNTGSGTAKSGGSVTFGGKTRYTDALSVYGEERIAHVGSSVTGLTHAYGVTYTPNDRWTFGASGEYGDVSDGVGGTALERVAVTGEVGYGVPGLSVGAAIEARFEEDSAKNTRDTYLGRATLSYKMNPDWRLQAKINAAFSESSVTSSFEDAEFIEASLGFAYRPINNDKLNALVKYTGHYDLPTSVATNATSGAAANYKQRSHIFSGDVIYDINEMFSVGAKYGLKVGERTTSRSSNDFYKSTVHLGVLRADMHVVKNWDAVIEARMLYEQESDTVRYGALAAVYRHFGDNFKVGVGYNFASFTDDLTNTDADAHGFFINAVSKF